MPKGKKKVLPEILVQIGEKGELAKLLQVSYPSVQKALEGRSKSLLSIKIRQTAIERGGVEIPDKNIADGN